MIRIKFKQGQAVSFLSHDVLILESRSAGAELWDLGRGLLASQLPLYDVYPNPIGPLSLSGTFEKEYVRLDRSGSVLRGTIAQRGSMPGVLSVEYDPSGEIAYASEPGGPLRAIQLAEGCVLWERDWDEGCHALRVSLDLRANVLIVMVIKCRDGYGRVMVIDAATGAELGCVREYARSPCIGVIHRKGLFVELDGRIWRLENGRLALHAEAHIGPDGTCDLRLA